MPRWILWLALATLVPGCALVREGGLEAGPEQFQFTVTPGPGAGPEADDLVADFSMAPGDEVVPQSAILLARAMTPVGQVDIVQFQMLSQGQVNECEGEFRRSGSSVACGAGGGADPLGGSAIAVSTGGIVDTWTMATIRVAPEVTTIVAVADDGTRYTIVPAAGYGFVVWPSVRGSLSLTALDGDGAAIGTTDGQGAIPEPAPIN